MSYHSLDRMPSLRQVPLHRPGCASAQAASLPPRAESATLLRHLANTFEHAAIGSSGRTSVSSRSIARCANFWAVPRPRCWRTAFAASSTRAM